ncbi:MAG: endonuclease/exonuclease/phosphatase family protein [Bacteroidota bacterium]
MKYFFLFFLLLTMQIGIAQPEILIDGTFDDWTSAPVFIDTQGDAGSSQIDFANLWVHDDLDFLYLNIEVGEEINMQEGNDISLYIDTDHDASTGLSFHGLGAELTYTFGDREGMIYLGNSNQTIYHSDIDLVSSPTVSSDQFEVVISKSGSFLGQALFAGDSIHIAFGDGTTGDLLPNSPMGIPYKFTHASPFTLPAYSIAKQQAEDVRVLSYNVLNDGLFDPGRSAAMARVLAALDPDLIGFQEIYNSSSLQVANEIESILPSASGEQWYHQQQGSDIIAISRYPILAQYAIDNNGAFLIDMDAVIGSKLLFIVAHTPCCGNNDGRQNEIDAMMAFVRDSKAGIGPLQLDAKTPIVIVGDMNLVGFQRQLRTLLTGDIVNEQIYGSDFHPDWDSTILEDAQPLTSGLPMNFTWFNESSSFSPGRLDFIVYSGSVMSMSNQFVLFSRHLPQDSLTHYQLLQEDVITASDHLPVVADFAFADTSATSIQDLQTTDSAWMNNHPNPFSGTTHINYYLPRAAQLELILYHQTGKKVAKLFHGPQAAGNHILDFQADEFASGIYLLVMKMDDHIIAHKMVIR